MIATITGVCLEVVEQEVEGKVRKVARVFQPGEKNLLSVNLNGYESAVGEKVHFNVRVIPYAMGREKIPAVALKVVE